MGCCGDRIKMFAHYKQRKDKTILKIIPYNLTAFFNEYPFKISRLVIN
jgi:hypothetical protein